MTSYTPPTDAPKMLPCPFCSSSGIYILSGAGDCDGEDGPYAWVQCATCGCCTEREEYEADAIAAWNRRPTTPPTDDEREAVARPSKFGKYSDYWNALCRSAPNRKWSIAQEREHAFDAGFDAALSALAPYRAREIAAAEARGVEMERARVVAWLPPVWFSTDYNWRQAKSAIERGEHDTGKEG